MRLTILLLVVVGSLLAACGDVAVVRYPLAGNTTHEMVENGRTQAHEILADTRPSGANYRVGPNQALGLQLIAGRQPVANAGGCRLELRFPPGTVESYRHYTWSTGVNARVQSGQYMSPVGGDAFVVPWSRSGGVQVVLDREEWLRLAASPRFEVSFFAPAYLPGRFEFIGARTLSLRIPAGGGDILFGTVPLPRQCVSYRRGRTPSHLGGASIHISESWQPFQ